MNKKDWNPDWYLKFDKERIQPSIDLVSHIKCNNPLKIIDFGCGPGNSNQIMVQKWSDSIYLVINALLLTLSIN
jgi:trans-aconitate 2-methyltransferase